MRSAEIRLRALSLALALLMMLVTGGVGLAQDGTEFAPTSGHAHVIAQGVVELPVGDAVWRTVRNRAPLLEDAAFEEQPLGFVLASTGPLLLDDEATGHQTRLGTGEAALVRAGTVQRRSSLTAQPVSYLSIELVAVDAPAPPAGTTVLQPGQPFAAPEGRHDLDLLSNTLDAGDIFTIPDSGAKNVILVTDGAANVGRAGSEPVVLLAGEAASFSGALEVSVADGGANGTSFVVAMIGPEIAAPIEAVADIATPAGTTETPAATADGGTIAIQVFRCPPGMDVFNVAAAACAPADDDFDITISGEALAGPLTLADATAGAGAYVWTGLPLGEYLIAEAVLPAGATTYLLAAPGVEGDAVTGYRVTLDDAQPNLTLRIYNFSPE